MRNPYFSRSEYMSIEDRFVVFCISRSEYMSIEFKCEIRIFHVVNICL